MGSRLIKFLQDMAGYENGYAVFPVQLAQQPSDFHNAGGIEAVDRLIQNQELGSA